MNNKRFRVPHTYVILFVMVIICALLTWIVPAGQYDRVLNEETGKNVVDPTTFHFTEGQGLSIYFGIKNLAQ